MYVSRVMIAAVCAAVAVAHPSQYTRRAALEDLRAAEGTLAARDAYPYYDSLDEQLEARDVYRRLARARMELHQRDLLYLQELMRRKDQGKDDGLGDTDDLTDDDAKPKSKAKPASDKDQNKQKDADNKKKDAANKKESDEKNSKGKKDDKKSRAAQKKKEEKEEKLEATKEKKKEKELAKGDDDEKLLQPDEDEDVWDPPEDGTGKKGQEDKKKPIQKAKEEKTKKFLQLVIDKKKSKDKKDEKNDYKKDEKKKDNKKDKKKDDKKAAATSSGKPSPFLVPLTQVTDPLTLCSDGPEPTVTFFDASGKVIADIGGGVSFKSYTNNALHIDRQAAKDGPTVSTAAASVSTKGLKDSKAVLKVWDSDKGGEDGAKPLAEFKGKDLDKEKLPKSGKSFTITRG